MSHFITEWNSSVAASDNVYCLILAWSTGLVLGLLTILRNSFRKPNTVILVLKRNISTLQRLCALMVVCTVPLAFVVFSKDNPLGDGTVDLTTYATRYSWNFGYGRALFTIITTLGFGSSASMHPSVRWSFTATLSMQVALDTIAETQLLQRIACIHAGRCPFTP